MRQVAVLVDWRVGNRAGRDLFLVGEALGKAPVDDERFAEWPEHDVLGFQIAMNDVSAMSVGDRVAGIDEAAQESPEHVVAVDARDGVMIGKAALIKSVDSRPQRFALDQVHGVKWASVAVSSQAVHRNDPGVLEMAGYFGLNEKSRPRTGVVREIGCAAS